MKQHSTKFLKHVRPQVPPVPEDELLPPAAEHPLLARPGAASPGAARPTPADVPREGRAGSSVFNFVSIEYCQK